MNRDELILRSLALILNRILSKPEDLESADYIEAHNLLHNIDLELEKGQ